ncbi:PTS sugar transporter subunit IIC [Clostridium sp. NSJ-49]|uniref:Permease IIC component n=1 Tax=Clostridium hominis TaxID=2763036 RepID=A0ABR7D9L8_9CLOT|nr:MULTISPECIES: PTS sugar transporter subunit IIC [Clostridium]MBC5625908.1 PTS sugar transporter subunit IIC [Clostridium sp. NSJ-49]MBC5628027.1 PTS sugar transporter subunit IIC [Clostridium hominis]MDU2673210.1 PTS sugar transporter subunit IIC [Clostridium sp.]
MLEKLSTFLDEKLSTPMAKLAEQRHLRAVRDGIISTLPLIIVGSLFLIIALFPFPEGTAIKTWLSANSGTILLPYRMTMYIMSLYAAWGIGYSLSRSYNLDGVTGGTLAATSFLLTLVPQTVEGMGWAMPMANLGGGGMFVAILSSIFAVEVLRFTKTKNIVIKMPDQVPASVSRSFEALTPAAIIIIFFAVFTYFLGIDWHGIIGKLVSPLVSATDTLPSAIFISTLIGFFWSFGIHGMSIVGSLARPLWLTLLDNNSAAVAAGQAAPHIFPEQFFQGFVMIGGAGATLGLAILLALRAKSQYGKMLGKTTVIPAIFNINEPIMFGAPIVLNPILIIPFILAPIINIIIAWAATNFGLVPAMYIAAPWTLPAPLFAFMATGGSWQAAILGFVLIFVSVLVYYPFFKMYDKKLLAEEQGEESQVA